MSPDQAAAERLEPALQKGPVLYWFLIVKREVVAGREILVAIGNCCALKALDPAFAWKAYAMLLGGTDHLEKAYGERFCISINLFDLLEEMRPKIVERISNKEDDISSA